MRKLHVVGFTTELDGLIFSTRKGSASGSFVVPISDELYEKLAEAERLRNGDEPSSAEVPRRAEGESRSGRPDSALTPREIQARLRAGRTIDEVAREAHVAPDWVDRFALPIIAEQAQIVELARGMTFSKPRLGPSSEPLGRSVGRNLIDRGVHMLDEEFDAGWSAYQVHDGVWMVRFQYHSRARLLMAAWEAEMASGLLTARDRLASDLGYVDPGGRRRSAPAEEGEEGAPGDAKGDGLERPPARRASPRRAGARGKTGGPAISTLPRTAIESAAKRPVPKSRAAASTRSRTPKAATGPKATKKAQGRGAVGGMAAGRKAATAPTPVAKGKRVAAARPAAKGAGAPARANRAATTSARGATAAPTGGTRATRGRARAGLASPEPASTPSTAARRAVTPSGGSSSAPPAPGRPGSGTRSGRASAGAGAPGSGSGTAAKAAVQTVTASSEAAHPERPKFGTDGTQLAKASNRPSPRPAPRPPTASPPPTPPPAPASRGILGLSARPTPPPGAQNGSSPPVRRVPPPQVPRPYEPRRPAPATPQGGPPRPIPPPMPPPMPSRSPASAVRPRPSAVEDTAGGRFAALDERRGESRPERRREERGPSEPVRRLSLDDLDVGEDFDLDEPAPAQPSPEPVRRGGLLARRRPNAPAEPGSEGEDDEGRNKPGGEDAFVIRPRISAKQASELAFTDEPLQRFRPARRDAGMVPPPPFPVRH